MYDFETHLFDNIFYEPELIFCYSLMVSLICIYYEKIYLQLIIFALS